MIELTKGKYAVRVATSPADKSSGYGLRSLCFGRAGGVADQTDATATHVIVKDRGRDVTVATFRMALMTGAGMADCYSSQFYDLEALAANAGPKLELGRFCVHPEYNDPDILRISWAALTAYADRNDIAFLFGCSSFSGTDPARYLDAFALLAARHIAPQPWLPKRKSAEIYEYTEHGLSSPDLKKANAAMPPLLRTYLMMGGWVSDHAVIDKKMSTLHVFTGLEIGRIPPARKKLLRALV